MKSFFVFTHRYDKLQHEEYTTVRGKTAINEYTVGQVVDIIVESHHDHHAEIIHMEHRQLSELSSGFMLRYTAIHGHGATDHATFIRILNSFRGSYAQIDAKDNPILTVFQLRKVHRVMKQQTLMGVASRRKK